MNNQFFLLSAKLEAKKGKKKSTSEKKDYQPDYNTFMEDFFSIILAQLYSVKVNPGNF